MSNSQPSAARSLPDATCLGCGCLCDDITLHVAGGRIVRAERSCPMGERWFLVERPADRTAFTVDGRAADLEAACARAAKILSDARAPLVMGLAGATCEAQRLAVAIADRLGACVDAGNEMSAATTAAIQSVGLVTATLGEVRHRADLVIFWGADPATTHPRHFERYSLTCSGELTPRGRADRTCVVVDCRRTPTADAADLFLQLKPGCDAAALDLLRALAAGGDWPEDAEVLKLTGVALAEWRALIERMKAARYGSLFFGSFDESLSLASLTATLESLFTLVRDMNQHTRFVALPLGGPANFAGAEQVLLWQTGFSSPVSFAAGYPQHDAAKHTAAAMLAAGEVDAVLIVSRDLVIDPVADLPGPARAQLLKLPTVVLHGADVGPPGYAAVTFTVATPGIHTGGTVFRSDGVPLPLRPAIESPFPTAEAVLHRLQESLQLVRGVNKSN